MPNSKLLKHRFYRSVSMYARETFIWEELVGIIHESSNGPSLWYPIYNCNWRFNSNRLARFSDVWHNYFCNALDLGIGGDRKEHLIWRVDNLSSPTFIKYVIIHYGTNNIIFNNPTDIANGISWVYFLI